MLLCNLSGIAKLTHQGPIDRAALVANGERLELSLVCFLRSEEEKNEGMGGKEEARPPQCVFDYSLRNHRLIRLDFPRGSAWNLLNKLLGIGGLTEGQSYGNPNLGMPVSLP